MTPQTQLDQALGVFQHGQLADAQPRYLRAPRTASAIFEALLGVVRAQQNRNAETQDLIGAAPRPLQTDGG